MMNLLQICSFSLHKTSVGGLNSCGSFVDCCCFNQLLTTDKRHPFTAEETLMSKCSVQMKKKLKLDGVRLSTFSAYLYFLVNYPFKSHRFGVHSAQNSL